MKKLTEFSVNYPVTVLMVVLAVILLGYISYDKLGVDLFPDLNSPKIFVEIESGERPPEEIVITSYSIHYTKLYDHHKYGYRVID